MILERTFYSVECDGCGCDLEVDEFGDTFCDDKQSVKDIAKDCGWIEVRGKHYCEECHHYGDNDELILGDGTVITEDEEDWQ